MSYERCKTCGTWGWENHKCPPVWTVATEDEPSHMWPVYAVDVEQAAEKAADEWDSEGEYYLARGNSMVFLIGGADGQIVRVHVEGETVPQYHAREIGLATATAYAPTSQQQRSEQPSSQDSDQ